MCEVVTAHFGMWFGAENLFYGKWNLSLNTRQFLTRLLLGNKKNSLIHDM
jgi:hypothetical protein